MAEFKWRDVISLLSEKPGILGMAVRELEAQNYDFNVFLNPQKPPLLGHEVDIFTKFYDEVVCVCRQCNYTPDIKKDIRIAMVRFAYQVTCQRLVDMIGKDDIK